MGFGHTNGEAAKPGDVLRTVAGTEATAVLIIFPIENIVATVLDRPVPTVDSENAVQIGLCGRATGAAVGDVYRSGAGPLPGRMPFNDVSLSPVRKGEIAVELRGGPNLPCFKASVIGGCLLHEMQLGLVAELGLQVFPKSALVGFEREMAMRLALPHQILGEGALGQQGVSGDVLASNRDGFQEGNGHLNFVGALGFFPAFYREGTHFFGV